MAEPTYKLEWDKTGEHYFETGVDHGVLYVYDSEGKKYGEGVVWNGLTSVSESPDGAEANDFYADNIKYASIRSAETFGGTIEAYTYPDEFAECDGSAAAATGVYFGQQARKTFGLSYRTMIGSDTSEVGNDFKINLVYGATCSPSEKSYETINDSPDAITFSWDFETTPVNAGGNFKPTSHIVIDSRKADKNKMDTLLKKLYGEGSSGKAELPTPDEVITMFTGA